MVHFYSGLDKIEQLQNHESVEIYKVAFDIIERYFSEVKFIFNIFVWFTLILNFMIFFLGIVITYTTSFLL